MKDNFKAAISFFTGLFGLGFVGLGILILSNTIKNIVTVHNPQFYLFLGFSLILIGALIFLLGTKELIRK